MTCARCEQLTRELREAREEVAEWARMDRARLDDDDVQRIFRLKSAFRLTECDARVLAALMARPGHQFTKENLLPYASIHPDDVRCKIVDVRICKIRKALAARPEFPAKIATNWGTGYSIAREDAQILERAIQARR